MDTKTGGILQIDFGICFGMGSSVLPVPEFMPFRLTAQLREILQPLDGAGLLRHYMVQGLQSLREEEFAEGLLLSRDKKGAAVGGLLTNALEVYVNDPVVDWLKAPLAKEVATAV
jgi:DNA-dependent protein kinase catalytic subunit